MDLICNGANVEDCLNLFNKVEILSNLKNFLLKNISESLSKKNNNNDKFIPINGPCLFDTMHY